MAHAITENFVLYESPNAAVANYQRLGGFKQHAFTLLQSWRLKPTVEVLTGLHSSCGLWGRLLSCLFRLLDDACITRHAAPASAVLFLYFPLLL